MPAPGHAALVLTVQMASLQQSLPSHEHHRTAAPVCAAMLSTAQLICSDRAGWQRLNRRHSMAVSDLPLRLPVLQGTTLRCWCALMARSVSYQT